MYNCSTAFKNAVANGAKQIALLLFNDLVMDNHDIDVTNGITFNDTFNPDENICIGKTLMNKVNFRIFNENGLLNGYSFGQFKATIGALISEGVFNPVAEIHLETGSNSYDSYGQRPFLRRNGIVVGSQPNANVKCMAYRDGYVYCFTESGCYIYEDGTGYLVSTSMNSFMINKANVDWVKKGCALRGNYLYVWEGVYIYTYEFVPLGYFFADRPNVGNLAEIEFDCDDRMRLADVDMPSDGALGIGYPITFQDLLSALCRYIGVSLATTGFINSSATIDGRPDEFDMATIRDVIGWIAEAAATNARFNRDGNLELIWFSSTNQSFDEGQYKDYHPYWYEVEQVSKLHNRSSSDTTESTVGSGSNGYLIQDNPLLKGVS